MIYSFHYFPEEIGRETVNKVELKGAVVDIHGQPASEPVKIGLNKAETAYKTQFNLDGAEIEASPDPQTGEWSALVPDNFHMPEDSYYRIQIARAVFRKFLPDFPYENSLNLLDDY